MPVKREPVKMNIHRSGLGRASRGALLLSLVMVPGFGNRCTAQEAGRVFADDKPTAAELAAWRKELLEIRKLFVEGEVHHQETYDKGRAELAAIDDPEAVPAIVKLLETEKNGAFRRALLQPLINTGGKEAVACLVKWSVEDQNPLLRQEACHGLVEQAELTDFVGVYIAYLAPVKQGLNVRFATEAAEALAMTELTRPLGPGELPHAGLVRVLVSALDSARVDMVQTDGTFTKNLIPDPRNSEARQKRLSPLAGVLPVADTSNPVVLKTLQDYTGQDFQYDQKAWLAWLEARLKEGGIPALPETAPEPKADPTAVAKWRKQLLQWRDEFFIFGREDRHTANAEDRNARYEAGRGKIAAVNDPAAIPAIIKLMETDKEPQFRRALLVPLIASDDPAAEASLVRWSVEDENPLLREEAAKALAGRKGLDRYLPRYIAYLKSPVFVANAAEALLVTKIGKPPSQSQTPDVKLAKALINAMHTSQYKVVPYRVAYDTGWLVGPRLGGSGTGTHGYRAWGTDEAMVRVKVPVPQPSVRAALKEYTGQDYEYDQARWREWLTRESGK
jgi:HEAT repeat protein